MAAGKEETVEDCVCVCVWGEGGGGGSWSIWVIIKNHAKAIR